MSSRRSRSRQSSGVSRITDDQINDLVSKLQQLLPELRERRSDKVSASKVLQETCNYIRNLHREVDDLSERLSELLATTDTSSAQAAIIRSLLHFYICPDINPFISINNNHGDRPSTSTADPTTEPLDPHPGDVSDTQVIDDLFDDVFDTLVIDNLFDEAPPLSAADTLVGLVVAGKPPEDMESKTW
ncbi:hypothetical protein NE237_021010 [Protea cynaroides]|uniref:BHLH domain-containing protein n=1 Tax=Protea cynaroides TaxID=273540 RepID=A0A9Q0K3Z0_9MAGN|nr:hypothetical protein NE237_021010 [Protea cynaroides]